MNKQNRTETAHTYKKQICGCQRGGGWGNGEMIKGTKFQLCRMNKSWRPNVQHDDYS